MVMVIAKATCKSVTGETQPHYIYYQLKQRQNCLDWHECAANKQLRGVYIHYMQVFKMLQEKFPANVTKRKALSHINALLVSNIDR